MGRTTTRPAPSVPTAHFSALTCSLCGGSNAPPKTIVGILKLYHPDAEFQDARRIWLSFSAKFSVRARPQRICKRNKTRILRTQSPYGTHRRPRLTRRHHLYAHVRVDDRRIFLVGCGVCRVRGGCADGDGHRRLHTPRERETVLLRQTDRGMRPTSSVLPHRTAARRRPRG